MSYRQTISCMPPCSASRPPARRRLHRARRGGHGSAMNDEDYQAALQDLQIALVDTQAWAMDKGQKWVLVFEGRDAAGKDGAIRVITQHLSNRNTRVVALPKPSDRDQTQWWFQRYIKHLPAGGEWVFYNRSWYNRAGVERV